MRKKRLIILVPGFQDNPVPGSQLNLLKNQIEVRDDLSSVPIAQSSYNGYRFETSDVTVDMFESAWQRGEPLLSSRGWITKLTWGALLLFMWLKPSTIVKTSGHKSWLWWFGGMLLLIVLWWYGAIASLLQASDPRLHLQVFGQAMQSWVLWGIMSSLLAALGVSVSAAVDIADLFRRYLQDARDDDGLPTRDVLRKTIDDAVLTLGSPSYDEVYVVGQSFGVILSIDAIAKGLSRKVHFISLGGFLTFLAAENAWVHDRIRACLRSPTLDLWEDYFSRDDVFAGPSPVSDAAPKYQPHEVTNGANAFQIFTGKSHMMYFGNSQVRRAMLRS